MELPQLLSKELGASIISEYTPLVYQAEYEGRKVIIKWNIGPSTNLENEKKALNIIDGRFNSPKFIDEFSIPYSRLESLKNNSLFNNSPIYGIIKEFVPGRIYVYQDRMMSPTDFIRLEEIVFGLFNLGISNLDVKEDNVLLSSNGPLLFDFDTCKLGVNIYDYLSDIKKLEVMKKEKLILPFKMSA